MANVNLARVPKVPSQADLKDAFFIPLLLARYLCPQRECKEEVAFTLSY